MEFTTKVETDNSNMRISHHDRIVMLGSCFTDNIGAKLISAGFDCMVNPFGALYNPVSVLNALDRRGSEFYRWIQKDDYKGGVEADIYILTFGTSWVYRLKETGHIVANCKKQPDNLFLREQISVEQIIGEYDEFINRVIIPQGKKIIFTVSPIRHKRDGMHANQLSKSILLLAIDRLCGKYPNACYYFPAYEIMMDELRDYRFYADDMIHPSPKAIDYLWQRFSETYFTKDTIKYKDEFERLDRTLCHRPSDPDNDGYRQLITKTREQIEKLRNAVRNK